MAACAFRAHLAEYGVIVAQGRHRVDALVAKLDEIREDLPEDACFALDALVRQLDALNRQIDGIDLRLAEIHKTNSICRLLATIPGIGPITATAFATSIPDPSAFRSGREFAAWLGLTPRQNSSGGKHRLGVLSQTFDFLGARDMSASSVSWQEAVGVIEFKGVHYPKSVILHAVFFYLRYDVSYRVLEEIMAERGVKVDHTTLNRWVVKFAPLIAARAQSKKRPTATSWRMDETYIRVKGKWTYLYRAVDRDGQTLDFLLSERRDLSAARRFLKRAIGTNGVPDRIVIDKSGANIAGLQAVNVILKFTGNGRIIAVRQVKYLNNILEQDHRFIKRITRPMMGFKAFHSAAATLAGI